MTNNELRAKAGQMVFVGFRGTTADEQSPIVRSIHSGSVGGLWLVDNETPMGATWGNIQSPEQVKCLTRELQGHAEIPLFLSLDAEGGEIIRLKSTYGFPEFPSAEELGKRNDLAMTRQTSRAIATLLKDLGFNLNFAPVVDVNPPAVICPSNMVVKTCGTNVLVTWTNLASDLCGGVSVSSSPAPGTYFLPNTTNVVTVIATDDWGNTNTCTFKIALVRPVLGAITITYSACNVTLQHLEISEEIMREKIHGLGERR